jgi:hypothetical protein
VRLAYRGGSGGSEVAPIVSEYIEKMQLRKIGYTFSGDTLSVFKGRCFSVIADEISKIEQDEIKRSRRGK